MSRALFVYMPVVHAGIIQYLRDNSEITVVLLDNLKAQSVNKFLERDIRALTAPEVQTALQAYGFDRVLITNQTNLSTILTPFSEVIIPEDEIIIDFLKQFAPEIKTTTTSLFVRWTKNISTIEHEVPSNRVISEDSFAKELLNTLEVTAQKSPDWWRQIAAALVVDGQVISSGYNEHSPSSHSLEINGDPRSNFDAGQGAGIYTSIHAEAAALAEAAKLGISTDGADAYVTTFPCPTCARSLAAAGIKRVFYRNGYSLVDAEQILKDAQIEIILVQK
jgi:dCMP deaminase